MSGLRNLKERAAFLMAALAAGVLMAAVLAGPAQAATLTVTAAEQNTDGQCSLREAIRNANQNDQSGSADCGAGGTTEDTINFQPSLSPATITLGSQLTITDSAGLIIDGGSASITVSGNNAVRVFDVVLGGAKLTLNNLTVANGSNNFGGGIFNNGTLTASNSTLSGNSTNNGGSLSSNGGTVSLENTIVANSPSGGNCSGTITNGGHSFDSGTSCGFGTANSSISGVDPMLGPLADNGGPTQTHALLADSPAIDKGNSFGATADQRGVARPQGAAPDIGAFEFENTTPPKASAATPTGKGIGRGANVAATFSEAMDAATINGATFKLSKAGSTNTLGAAVAYDAASRKAVLNPNKRLAAGTKYRAVVTIGAEDLAGNALDQNPTKAGNQQKSWTFTTKG